MTGRLRILFRWRPMTLDQRLAEHERRRAEYFENLRQGGPS